VDPTPNQAEPQAPPEAAAPQPAEGKRWSPFSTSRARWAWGLMAVYSVIYFVVAVLTSAEFADFAAQMVLGLPLGFYLGMGVIIAGLVITRIYLAKIEN
jgi:putative solute:sodium symporter small subunit